MAVSLGGLVQEIHVQEGDKAMVGQLILPIASDGAGEAAEKPPEETESSAEISPPPEIQAEEARPEQAEPVEKKAVGNTQLPEQAFAVIAFAARPSTDQGSLQRVIPASPAIRRVAGNWVSTFAVSPARGRGGESRKMISSRLPLEQHRPPGCHKALRPPACPTLPGGERSKQSHSPRCSA